MWKHRLTLFCATRERLYVHLGLFSRLLCTLSAGVPGRMRRRLYTCDVSVVDPGWPICRRRSILQSVCLVLLSRVSATAAAAAAPLLLPRRPSRRAASLAYSKSARVTEVFRVFLYCRDIIYRRDVDSA